MIRREASRICSKTALPSLALLIAPTAFSNPARFTGVDLNNNAPTERAVRTIGQFDKAWDDAIAKGWTVIDMK